MKYGDTTKDTPYSDDNVKDVDWGAVQSIGNIIMYLPKTLDDEIKTESGVKLYKDPTFNPVENRIQQGLVVVGGHLSDVRKGDKIWFHPNIVSNPKYQVSKSYYAIPDDENEPMAYAVERDGEVITLYDYIFIEGEEDVDSEILESGIIISSAEKKKMQKERGIPNGWIRYASEESLRKLNCKIGDKVNFRRFRNAKYDIHGEQLFRVKVKDINWIYNAEEA